MRQKARISRISARLRFVDDALLRERQQVIGVMSASQVVKKMHTILRGSFRGVCAMRGCCRSCFSTTNIAVMVTMSITDLRITGVAV